VSGPANLKARGECPCGCGAYGRLRPGKHNKECDRDKCASCRNGGNRRRGVKAQAKGARRIGYPTSTLRPGNEEHMGGHVRFEAKSGAIVRPAWTAYLKAEVQSEGQRPFGDNRPFVFLAMTEDGAEGLVVFRQSKLDDVVIALAEQRGLVA
jgi:hypothetical protein